VAVDFVGSTNSYLNLSVSRVNSYPVTFAAWVNMDSVSQQMFIVTRNSSQHRHYLQYDSGLVMTSFDTSSSNSGSAGSMTAGAWTHVAGWVASANSRKAYKNGVPGSTGTGTKTISGMNTLSVGARLSAAWGYHLNGRIELPAVWNAVLSDTEIKALASGAHPLSIRPSDLIFLLDTEDNRGAYRNLIDGQCMTVGSTSQVSFAPGRRALLSKPEKRILVEV